MEDGTIRATSEPNAEKAIVKGKLPLYPYLEEEDNPKAIWLEERLKHLEDLLQHTLEKNGLPEVGPADKAHTPFRILDLDTNEETQSNLHRSSTRGVTFSPQGQQGTFVGNNFVDSDLGLPQSPSHDQVLGETTLVHEPPGLPAQPSLTWKGSLELGPFSLPSFHELPAEPVALELVKETFRNFNCYFPLFDEEDFLQQFQHQYSQTSPSNPAWWACINVVLSLAYRFRAMQALQTAYENTQSCGYIHNALAVVSELSVLRHSLPAIQALVGMAIILQGTPNPQASSVLNSAALRLAQAMGLHRKTQDRIFSVRQIEQRKRVFWIAYFLDKDISLRMGQPFAQDDDDMDIELPTETLTDLTLIGLGDEFRKFNFFNSRIGLAVIQGQIYKRLYSVQASRQSEAQKAAVAYELNSVLAYWRSSVPVDFEDNLVAPLQTPLSIGFIHMLILRFTYINCLVMIDRHLPPLDSTSPNPRPELTESFMFAESLCIVESRKSIRLIQITPPGDYACVWILLHSFFAAVEGLLNNLLRHPGSPQASSDLNIVEPFIRLLEILAGNKRQCAQSEEAEQMYRLCTELRSRAREAVEQSNMSLEFGLMSDLEQ
ncbi:hypothetical protein J7T55_014244 [Diaporthe amygdali]|uniref:uncharacterized protein n=1 Tax=Phomopsis amygdali TaxID=1214568 RepID=UPI0022FF3C7E|nr:uncharacterized protein J7T55_014244 [Diaporthe amygdali]KAJ0109682.1 hypothetical protein J7T55_014244 [Diaporthe amygdali]